MEDGMPGFICMFHDLEDDVGEVAAKPHGAYIQSVAQLRECEHHRDPEGNVYWDVDDLVFVGSYDDPSELAARLHRYVDGRLALSQPSSSSED